jgi:hypothetical protein
VLFLGLLYAIERWRFTVLRELHLDHGWWHQQASRSLNGSAYDSALQTIGGVGGVFVALYFGTISGIIGGLYAQTPHNVRDLLLRDRTNNAYVGIIALLTAIAALLGLIRSAGVPPWHSAIVALGVMIGVGVFAFVKLLRRAFLFFDPTVFAPGVCNEFLRWAERAAGHGAATSDPYLQETFRRRAESAVSALEAIVDVVAAKPSVDPDPVLRMDRSLAATVARYTRIKQRIPTGSKWFELRAQHLQWYLSSITTLAIAGSTFTALPPQQAPNPLWVEDRITAAQLELLLTLI